MIRRSFWDVQGASRTDCVFLANRWSDRGGWSADACDSWVVGVSEVAGEPKLQALHAQSGRTSAM